MWDEANHNTQLSTYLSIATVQKLPFFCLQPTTCYAFFPDQNFSRYSPSSADLSSSNISLRSLVLLFPFAPLAWLSSISLGSSTIWSFNTSRFSWDVSWNGIFTLNQHKWYTHWFQPQLSELLFSAHVRAITYIWDILGWNSSVFFRVVTKHFTHFTYCKRGKPFPNAHLQCSQERQALARGSNKW